MESFLSEAGLAAVFLFGFLEACCVPIPSEITFGFAGVLAGEGHFSIVAVIIVGTVAELLGSFVAYTVGRVGERPLVHKFGRYLLITHADIDRAERFFAGRGAWALLVGRCLPVVRTFVSIVAGFSQMPALLFGVLSLIGTAIWVTAISLIGYSLSSTWQSIAHGIALAGYAIAAVAVIAIAAFVMYRLREFRKEAALASPAVTSPAVGAPTPGDSAAGARSGPRHSRTAPEDPSRTASQDPSRTAPEDPSRTAHEDSSHTAPQDDQPRPRSPMS
jgi:membrane protein DedA with SNARE-associated domain